MTIPVPKLLGGRYEVGELIARGGMAEVHHGYDTRLGRTVAIKILRSDHVRDAHFLSRFRREAQSVAGLNHRNIVAVYDSGEDQLTETGGARVPVPWIIMEYVDGYTLRELLNEHGDLPPQEAARITESVLDALAYSHEMGMVHRDIKPANVMVAGDGTVKVMDFGIARAVADTQATMTHTSSVMGTAQYISPEQAEGLTVDSRSDLYSTGCLLFELLTGRTPFVGEPVSLTYQHVSKPPPLASSLNPAVSEDLDAVIALALTKDREQRYQEAEDFRDDLRSVRLGRPVSAAAYAALRADQPTAVVAPAQHIPPTPVDVLAPEQPYDEPRRRGSGVLIASILLLAVGVLGFAAKIYLDSRPEYVTVPSVVGKTLTKASSDLQAAGFEVSSSYQPSSEYDKDKVMDQDPKGGTEQLAGKQINLTVSGGPAATRVPPLAGLTLDEATAALEDAGLELGDVRSLDSPDAKKDEVVSSTPEEYADAAEGDEVDLTVGTGKVALPDLVGKTQDEARAILAELKLPVLTVLEESSETEDTVLRTDPKKGEVNVGTTVTLTLAKPRTIVQTTTITTTQSSTPPPTEPTTSTDTATSTSTTPPPTDTGTGGGGTNTGNTIPTISQTSAPPLRN
ncbi:MAG: Stk1 family PASTA domain-containing Ser/Thr kinase [Actinobacteria bacterium]|nr:Stk1 family PASTA domain-containing Ser/Thr kinase [Actinomycetota bacterium]